MVLALALVGGYAYWSYLALARRRDAGGLSDRLPEKAWHVLHPWRAAHVLFQPWRPWYDAVPATLRDRLASLDLLGWGRSVGGFAVVLLVADHYADIDPTRLADDRLQDVSTAIALSLMVVPATTLVMVACTVAPLRRTVVRRALIPLSTTMLLVLTTALVTGLSDHGVTVRHLFSALMFAWLGLFLVFAFLYAARHLLNVADAHPMLAPICTIEITWLITAWKVLYPTAAGVPVTVSAIMAVGGSLTVTALALWELRVLRSFGLSFRTGTTMRQPPP